ncbi:MAG TPA: N-acetyl-gamma-glutamyl-phosphate reductase [Acidocella sp.]|nr:MAG: N-acetyl-gamma-glutamyl-phosphate reductase [Acidocella sp. 20-58-15]HQT39239.1 N-acetyl-gamma-glutamyl-phosphate reductase [Acidocella sp.]
MARLFIDGEAGTTGLGIRERVLPLAGIELVSLRDADRKNQHARLEAMRSADLVVLCLPDEAARDAAAMVESLGDSGPKLLDASSAHRVSSGWVYGFPELSPTQAAAIASAKKVSNPGCYATGAIALLCPLIDAGIITPDHDITINAISGYSGGGKAMIAAHEADGGPAFELYGLGLAHKHVPEIISYSGLSRRPLFVPSVGHFRQGMLVSIPLFLDRLPGRPSGHEIVEAYHERFGSSLRVRPPAGVNIVGIEPQACNDTDLMDIFVCANAVHDHAVLIARLDNLGKGASGAAVQNIALMLGLPDPLALNKELHHA